MVNEYNVIGRPLPRTDGKEKVTGNAAYSADIKLPDTLWGKALRSPFAHARIVSINTEKARQIDGVYAVLTGDDVRGVRYGRRLRDVPVLAEDEVRFIGERVAAVAAIDEDIAQKALDLIDVEYEELPALIDPLEAMKDDAPLVHPDMMNYQGYMTIPGVTAPPEKPSNIFSVWSWGKGDVEEGFNEADFIVESTYTTPVVHHAYLEPNSCVVWIDNESKIQVWASNKSPYDLRRQLSEALAVPEAQVVLNSAYIGGDFGGKGSPMDVPLCYFLAKASGRPVRIVMDYVEEFMAGDPRHASITRFKTGVKNNGSLTAHKAEIIFNSGAYGGFKPAVNLPGAMSAGGLYKVPHSKIESKLVYTHAIHGGHMRSPGEPQTSFAMESHIDEIACHLGIDPLEYRRQNLIEEGDSMASGLTFHDIRARETLEAAISASGYNQEKSAYIGRGIGMGERPAGGGQANSSVVMDPTGGVTLHTVLFDQGSGTNTSIRQIVAEELGLPIDRVSYVVGTTETAPYDSGLGAARATRIESDAANKAVVDAREKVIRLGAELSGWSEEKTLLIGEELINQESGEKIPWKNVLQRTGESVTGIGEVNDMSHPHNTGFVAQVAEVSIDPETGEIKLLNFTTAHDVGTVLNPVGHQGQINGGVMMGIGFGLMEEIKSEDGRISTLSFGDFKVPTIADIPQLETVLVHSDGGTGPYHVKSIAESPNIPVAGAIANAIRDAIGIRITDLPITAEKVYRAIKSRS